MFRPTSRRDSCDIIIDDESSDLAVGSIDLKWLSSFAARLHSVQSFPNCGQKVRVVGVEGLLLVNDVLNLVEKRGGEVLLMLGQRNKDGNCFLEVQIAINVLLVQLLHNQLLQLWA